MNDSKIYGQKQIITDLLLNAGIYSKVARKANLELVFRDRNKFSGVSLDGSLLKVNVTRGIECPADFMLHLQEILNGHETTLKTDDRTGRLEIIVDLLKIR